MSEDVKIAACPFCRSNANVSVADMSSHRGDKCWFEVRCDTCEAGGPSFFYDPEDNEGLAKRSEAIAAWNRRPSLEPVPAPSGVELTGDFPERIWAGDFDSHGLGHATAGMQGGLYEEYVLASSIALTPLTQEPEPVGWRVEHGGGATFWNVESNALSNAKATGGVVTPLFATSIKAEPATGRVLCAHFIADPCGSAKCAGCGKRRRDHPVISTAPTPPVENVGEVTPTDPLSKRIADLADSLTGEYPPFVVEDVKQAALAIEALQVLYRAVCGETGFAEAVRNNSGFAYPWPALDEAEALACAALSTLTMKGEK